MNDDPLALDPETMRQLGYRAVDMLVERLGDDSIPPLRRATADEMERRLAGPPPEEPQDFDEILRRLDEDVLPFMSRGDHPGFFAFIPFSGTWPGVAPGTGTPEPGGLTPSELLWAARTVAAAVELVGAEIVEVIPTAVGSADVTALVAERTVREVMTGIALRRCSG